ncbi:hypothetical protein [Curtobacterium ammoniigenes]|uniref:hypothetical protein n=1 Tax=Curtobacterium ammoniigenes TaxID=395387 RepID=UPI00082BE56B|nr:hypothetical protein [Curtobacterium ammoniigenes]
MSPDEQRELDALRARAFGPRADIAQDPAALERLAELERAAVAVRVRQSDPLLIPARSGSGDRAPAAVLSPPSASENADELPRAGSATTGEATEHRPVTGAVAPLRSRRAVRFALMGFIAALVLVVGGVAIGRTTAAQQGADGSTVIARLPVDPTYKPPAALQGSAVAIVTGFRDFHGLRPILGRGAWFGTNSSEYCLFVYPQAFVVDSSAPSYTGPQWTGCGAGAFPPETQLDVTGDLPASVRAPFSGPTALRFVYDATKREVIVYVAN